MNLTIAGMIGLLALMLVSRAVNEKALRKLDDNQKAALMKGMSKIRFWNLGVLIALIALYFLIMKVAGNPGLNLSFIYFGVLFVYIIVIMILGYRIMKKINLPQNYIKVNILAQSLQLLGLMSFIAMFLYEMVSKKQI